MRNFLCTRSMPVGGSWKNPKYRVMKFTVEATTGPEASRIADDVQANAKIKRWGQKPMIKLD